MKAEECARILGCLAKSPYLVKWIGINENNASVTMSVGNLDTEIVIGKATEEEEPVAKVFFSNGTVMDIIPATKEVVEDLYNKCVELRDIVVDYSKVVLLNSCCANSNVDRTND